ncbi:hypothetical protein N9H34_01390 [bacterium]|nr:hypothetical protein [bacterium]
MDLTKIRLKHRKTLNIWRYIHQTSKFNKPFSKEITRIIRETHSEDELRWRSPMGSVGSGYYNYDEDTKSYSFRSGINFINTGFSYQEYIERVLNEKYGIKLPYETDNEGKYIDETVEETLKEFCYYLELYKEDFLFDGDVKNHIDLIRYRLKVISDRSEKLIENNFKNIWPDSISYLSSTGNGGNIKDFRGIDAEIVFDRGVETVQCKEVSFIEEDDNKIILTLTMDHTKYSNINYYAFTQDNNYIVFKNDSGGIEILNSMEGNVYSFNKDLIVYSTF